jgi:hypothetical protein
VSCLRNTRTRPDLGSFIDGLPASVRSDLDAALSIFEDPSQAAFKAALGRARNHFFHYPRPGNKELRRALAAFARDNHDGELWLEYHRLHSRARWADDVAAQLLVRAETDDQTPIREYNDQLQDLAVVLVRLLVAIINTYFDARPDGVVVPIADD